MADETANKWKLYYWPKLAGRAEFVRVIFEEAGVQFEEINDVEVLVPMFRESKVDKFCDFGFAECEGLSQHYLGVRNTSSIVAGKPGCMSTQFALRLIFQFIKM